MPWCSFYAMRTQVEIIYREHGNKSVSGALHFMAIFLSFTHKTRLISIEEIPTNTLLHVYHVNKGYMFPCTPQKMKAVTFLSI